MPKTKQLPEDRRARGEQKIKRRTPNLFSVIDDTLGRNDEQRRIIKGDLGAAATIEARKPKMTELERQKFLAESLRRQGIT